MTAQDLFVLINDYKLLLLLGIFLAPWIAFGICVVIPGQREEPFVLNCNLAMAVLSLLLALGYLLYAVNIGGWVRVVQEADLLLILAPVYYVGVSLWISKQRLPLQEIPVFRAIQGIALIVAGYLGLTWFLSNLRFLAITFVPLQVLLVLVLILASVAYLGYLRLTGKDTQRSRRNSSSQSIDDQLESLRRDLRNRDR